VSEVRPWYGFLDPIDARYVIGEWMEVRYHDVRYLSRYLQEQSKPSLVRAEVGFKWNLASIPGWVPRGIFDRFDLFPAALPHDKIVDDIEKGLTVLTPDDADAVFLEIMAGVFHERTKLYGYSEPEWKRNIAYAAVNRFGPHHANTLNLSGEGFQLPLGD
jgi:hypothetical protein